MRDRHGLLDRSAHMRSDGVLIRTAGKLAWCLRECDRWHG